MKNEKSIIVRKSVSRIKEIIHSGHIVDISKRINQVMDENNYSMDDIAQVIVKIGGDIFYEEAKKLYSMDTKEFMEASKRTYWDEHFAVPFIIIFKDGNYLELGIVNRYPNYPSLGLVFHKCSQFLMPKLETFPNIKMKFLAQPGFFEAYMKKIIDCVWTSVDEVPGCSKKELLKLALLKIGFNESEFHSSEELI